jgi:Meiotically up-regulated gene 113
MSRQCSNCGRPTTSRYGYCNRTISCKAKNQAAAYADAESGLRGRIRAKQDRLHPVHAELTYVVHSRRTGLYKIGHTKRLSARLVAIRSGCPDAEVIREYAHDRELERYLRGALSLYRFLNSDWYELASVADTDRLVLAYQDSLGKTHEKAA